MTNEEMFKLLLDEIKGIKGEVKGINERLTSLEAKFDTIDNKLDDTIRFNQTTALDTVEYIYSKLATKDDIRDLGNKVSIINDDLLNQKAIVRGIKESTLKS